MKSKSFLRLMLILWLFSPAFLSLSQSSPGKTQDSVLLQSKITMLENEINELKDILKNEVYPTPPIPLRYIPIWLTTMTFLLTIFLGIATFQSFIKVKEAKEQMTTTQKIMEESESTLYNLKNKYEGEMKLIRDEFEKTSK